VSGPSIKDKLNRLREAYAAQLPEKINGIEKDWVVLQGDPDNAEGTRALFRAVHTLKGSSASFGFKEVSIAVSQLASELKIVVEKGCLGQDLLEVPMAIHIEKIRSAFSATAGKGGEDAHDTTVIYEDTETQPFDESGQNNQERKIIFLVEDDPAVLETLSLQISHFGYEVKSFADLAPLRKELERTEPSAIIMDMVFPGGELAGAVTMTTVQAGRKTKIPLIFISIRNDFEARLQAVRAGADAYFLKPVSVGPLVDKLDAITRKEVVEPYRILIIDDDVDLSSFYSLVLQDAGMAACVVNHPKDAIAAIIKFNPDLILMDVYMPECSGLELAKIIRAMDPYVSIPIVFLSAETNLMQQMSAMSMGGDDFLTKPIQAGHLISSVSMRAERMRIIRSYMERDSLTGLLNHTKTNEQLDIAMERARRQHTSLSFAMIDIDNFKEVNDSYGHPAGDRVIMSLARLFEQRLRKTDVVGRYGGEEFAVILSDAAPATAAKVLDAIRLSFSRLKNLADGREFSVTFSCGIAAFSGHGDVALLRSAADKALYEAKRGGRNRIVLSARE
jgi:diguanylate cyclase (GGDEF)-like protein